MRNKTKDIQWVGMAGTLESSDALVTVRLDTEGKNRVVRIVSPSVPFFEQAMRETVFEVLNALGVTAADIEIRDQGALDFALRARVETAVRRACAAREGGV